MLHCLEHPVFLPGEFCAGKFISGIPVAVCYLPTMSPSFGSPDRPKNSSDNRAVDAALSENLFGIGPSQSVPQFDSSNRGPAQSNAVDELSLCIDNDAIEELHYVTVRRVHHPRFRLDWLDVRDYSGSTPQELRLTLVYEPDPKISRVINLSEVLVGNEQRERIERKLVNIVSVSSPDTENIQYDIDFVLRELVPSLLITGEPLIPAFQNRASKHREPISLQRRFAPDVSEFLRGINRTAFLLTRGEELIAEFVLVDNGQSQISAYVNLAGANNPLPFLNAEGSSTSLESFPLEVFETVYPFLRSKFTPLGQVLTHLTDELNTRRLSSMLSAETDSDRRKKEENNVVLLPSSSDWMRITVHNQEALRFGDSAVRAQPRMVVPSLPIDQLYMFGTHRSLPTAVGGEIQLFPSNEENHTLLRFVATCSRKPAVFLEVTIPDSVEHTGQRISRFSHFQSERLLTEGIADIIGDRGRNIRLFGSVVGDSYSLNTRELLSHLNKEIADIYHLHFGFVSDVLPSLTSEPANAAVQVLMGKIPFSSIIEDRLPGQYSVAQFLVDSEGRGTITFYSRLGAALSFATFDTPDQPGVLRESLSLLYRTFVEDPDALPALLLSCPGLALEYCSEEPLADKNTKLHLAELAEAWWQSVPTFGYGSDELFPILTRSQVQWLTYHTVLLRLPLPRCSPFQECTCTVTSTGVTSIEMKERASSHYQDPSVLLIYPRQGVQVSPQRILSAVTAISIRGLLQSKAYRECEKVFPAEDFYFERSEPPFSEASRFDGIIYTLKEWLLRLRLRLPW